MSRKISVSNVYVIVASWLLALIALYGYYSFINHNHHRSQAYDKSINIAASEQELAGKLQASSVTHTIPSPSLSINTYDSSSASSSRRFVLFDWPLDSDNLAYLNYKSFESFLANGMDANTEIEIMIIGYGVASFYKIGHLFRYSRANTIPISLADIFMAIASKHSPSIRGRVIRSRSRSIRMHHPCSLPMIIGRNLVLKYTVQHISIERWSGVAISKLQLKKTT
jgi:hypothetical protein